MVPLLATPDFGASGIVVLFLLGAFAVVLSLALVGFIIGMRMYRKRRNAGFALSLFSALLPVICYFAPRLIFCLTYGHFPLGTYPDGIVQGMTQGEVQAILGTPQNRSKLNGEERWLYYIDSFGAQWFGVDFAPDGRVTGTYGN